MDNNEFDKNSAQNFEKERKKKTLVICMGVCIAVIILAAFLVMYYKSVDAKTFKLFINDAQVAVAPDFYVQDQSGNTYVNARQLAGFIGWDYQNGEYGSFTEDTNSGYLKNDYEAASFVADSTELKKYIDVNDNLKNMDDKTKQEQGIVYYPPSSLEGTLETTKLELPVLSFNNQIYFPLASIGDICNCRATYENNRMYIYEQNFLINLANMNATNWGYTSLSGAYENIRALAYGMLVVNKNGSYGVVSLYDNSQYLGFKYTNVLFSQNVKEFFVFAKDTDGEETVGIVSYDGTTIISPKAFENISIISDELGLYLVEKDEEYGVLDRNGKVIVNAEFDDIGLGEELRTLFKYKSEDNQYVLFNNTIVVQKEGQYGLYNLDGDETVRASMDSLGYNVEEDEDAKSDYESVLTISKENLKLSDGSVRNVQGIVLKDKNIDGNTLYGVYDAVSGKVIIPINCDRIYSTTKGGVTTYYIEWQGYKYEFESYITEYPQIFE